MPSAESCSQQANGFVLEISRLPGNKRGQSAKDRARINSDVRSIRRVFSAIRNS